MAKQVLYVSVSGQIIDWQDTSAYHYPSPQPGTVVLPVSDQQWAGRSAPAHVVAGVLVPGALPLPPALAAQQAYVAAVNAGVTISSVSAPAINGTFPLDQPALMRISAEQTYIATTGTFTNKAATKAWRDIAGAPRLFPSTVVFTAFAEAVAQYDDALLTALAGGIAGATWEAPPMPAPII